jgi:histidine ammonia-lyase
MKHSTKLGRKALTLEELEQIINTNSSIDITEDLWEAVKKCRAYLDAKVADGDSLYYGINTGFGSLCNIAISKDQISQLQHNLVRSHACGMGEEVPLDIVKIILLTKIRSLSYGHSAVQPEVLQRLIDQYNSGLLPKIYELGSLGASGDLAPLAHLSLPLFGEGELWDNGSWKSSESVLKERNWENLTLSSKEGLALLNGTQFSLSHGLWSVMELKHLWNLATLTAAISLDAFDCRMSPFDEKLHRIRPHAGQIKTAAAILGILKDSKIAHDPEKASVQDPYAFRCVPQVHGASWDSLQYAISVLETELNAVTDNPNVFPDEDEILSGGNFHAQPLAVVLDFLAIAASELGSIAERRVYQLISGLRGLPAFLVANPGLNSGFMIPQYTAASIASQNKQLCTPASVDSIVSSNGQEDHVSMAANAGTKLTKVIRNLERILAIEFMTAVQALEFRAPKQSSNFIVEMINDYRKVVPFVDEDRYLSKDMHETVDFLRLNRDKIAGLFQNL